MNLSLYFLIRQRFFHPNIYILRFPIYSLFPQHSGLWDATLWTGQKVLRRVAAAAGPGRRRWGAEHLRGARERGHRAEAAAPPSVQWAGGRRGQGVRHAARAEMVRRQRTLQLARRRQCRRRGENRWRGIDVFALRVWMLNFKGWLLSVWAKHRGESGVVRLTEHTRKHKWKRRAARDFHWL